ncbi:glycosyltransferase family 2 protein [Oscillatoria salina IIICB1]|nr:glycosyltransferase family 2 protein [Oscillatoria salina IIICB1]NET88132.1 glycosyltransferase family 2 protein [Kamptonema sp. SIO1D9]
MKLVSVIIPVYKKERYIAATVQSVLAQTYPHFELLIVDDGSPDRSVEICQQFDDSRIKIIRQANQGVSAALNTGIRHAKGEYIAFLDGDDLWLPENLAKQLEHLEKSPQVGVSFSRSALIDAAGKPLGTYLMPQLKGITVPSILRSYPLGNGSAAVLRRKVLEEIRFRRDNSPEYLYYDEELSCSQDIECLLRIAIKTDWEIEGISEPLTLYRVSSGGLSANYLKKLEIWETVLSKIRAYAPEEIAPWENPSKAYQFRYLARKAIRLHDGKAAVDLCHRAIATYWQIIFEEPRRTFFILAAAYALILLPMSLYDRLETTATKLTAVRQKRRILQEQQQ